MIIPLEVDAKEIDGLLQAILDVISDDADPL